MKLSKSYNAFGMAALGLALAFSFSACDNPTQVEGTVGISSQDGLDVTATPVMGGVLLEWNPVLDGESYKIWRVKKDAKYKETNKDGDQEEKDVKPVALDSPLGGTDKATGKVYIFDLMSDTNVLEANTEYVYTIITSGNSKTDSKTEKEAKTGAIPDRNTQLTRPIGVNIETMDKNQKAGKITVTWDKPDFTKVVPATYTIQIVKDGNTFRNFSKEVLSYETSATFNWPEDVQDDGVYQAAVMATASNYFKRSEPFYSNKAPFESLFGTGFFVSTAGYTVDSNNNIRFIPVALGSNLKVKTDVTYTVQRAKLTDDGNVGPFERAYIYATSDTSGAPVDSWKSDLVGNLPTVYNRVDTTDEGRYQYQIIATKEAETQIKKLYPAITIDLRSYAYSTLNTNISRKTITTADSRTYEIAPSLSAKGALKTGDKLVFYYVLNTRDSSGSTGPYSTKGIEFTKGELEGGVTRKDITVYKVIGETNIRGIYVQAYIEYADGRDRENVSNTIYIPYSEGERNNSYAELYGNW